MIRYLLLGFLSLPAYSYTSPGGTWGLLELEKAGMNARKIWFLYDPYIPEYTSIRYPGETRDNENFGTPTTYFESWTYGVDIRMDVNLVRIGDYSFFWNNTVRGNTTTNQFRHIGWEWNLGFDIWKDHLKVYYHHHSEHVMENTTRGRENYPLLDELVLEMTFYTRSK